MKLIAPRESCFHYQENVYTHCVQMIQLKGNVSSKTMKTSVQHLSEKYEILQQGMIVKDEKNYFQKIENFQQKLNFFEVEKKQENWEEVFRKEIKNGASYYIKSKKELNESQNEYEFTCGLMWKIYFISSEKEENFEIILCIDHIIADGVSICVLVSDLIKFIQSIENEENIEYKTMEIAPGFVGLFENEKPEIEKFSPKYVGLNFDIDSSIKNPELNQEFVFHEFKGDKLSSISKQNKVTVNTTIGTALIMGFMKFFCREEYGNFLKIIFPISLRNLKQLDANLVGMLISFVIFQMESKIDFTKIENFWETARTIQAKFYSELEKKSYLNWIQNTDYEPTEKEVSNENTYNRDFSFAFSNRGKLDHLFNFKKFELKGFYNSANVEGSGVGLVHLSTIQNRFFFTVSAVTPLFSKEKIENFVSYSMNILENLK
jgi:hypothetical protein